MKCFFYILALFPMVTFSCTTGTYEEELQLAKDEYKLETDFVEKVFIDADAVFTATITNVVERDPNLTSDKTIYYDVSLKLLSLIKGNHYQNIFLD